MIRKATVHDVEKIRVWLQQEKDGEHDSFIVYFNLIEEGQANDLLTVLVDDIPIAFALEDDNLAILDVKLDRRHDDVGRILANPSFMAVWGIVGGAGIEPDAHFASVFRCSGMATIYPHDITHAMGQPCEMLPQCLNCVCSYLRPGPFQTSR